MCSHGETLRTEPKKMVNRSDIWAEKFRKIVFIEFFLLFFVKTTCSTFYYQSLQIAGNALYIAMQKETLRDELCRILMNCTAILLKI